VTTDERAAPLKRDLFGAVWRRRMSRDAGEIDCVERDTTVAAHGVRWLARRLASREARALSARSLAELRRSGQVPTLVSWDGRRLQRTWLAGVPLQLAGGAGPGYFREALRLLRRLHAAGIVHNDLAKEPNWLVTDDGRPALVDFQLAMRPRRRGRRFRMLAYDDLRHLLKHKRTYCPAALTMREQAILARRSPLASLWARTGKPVYRFVTRRLLGWSDREGAADRGSSGR
jgi:RIO-like serine/threonine protein kinase